MLEEMVKEKTKCSTCARNMFTCSLFMSTDLFVHIYVTLNSSLTTALPVLTANLTNVLVNGKWA